jgi:hypothetical protein
MVFKKKYSFGQIDLMEEICDSQFYIVV